MKSITIILLACLLTISLAFKKKTNQSITQDFLEYDRNHDSRISIQQMQDYFYNGYMSEFAGIQIDPKFLDSTLKYLKKADKDGDGADLQEFLAVLLPKQRSDLKMQPDFYDEQDL